MNVIDKLKNILEKEGVSRYQISKNTGISEVLLYRYWRGDVIPNLVNFEKIVDFLGYEITFVKKKNQNNKI